MQIATYLSFNGDCAEAFAFYAKCLDAPIAMTMLWGDTPMKDQVDASLHGLIAHTRIKAGETVLMGSDSPPTRFKPMEGAVVSVEVADAAEARRIFEALSEGATVQMPIQKTFWSAAWGTLRDRYGISWMVGAEPG